MSLIVGVACDECGRVAASTQTSRPAARLAVPDVLRLGVVRSTEALLAAGGSTDDERDRCATCTRVGGELLSV